MIKFRARNFSNYIISDAATGAQTGAILGTLFSPAFAALTKKATKMNLGSWVKYVGSTLGVGLLVGAALGILVGAVRTVGEKINQETTTDDRLMKWIIQDLKNKGFKEGTDFTRDPKTADRLRTKISIVVSRVNGDLKLVINAADDIKLSRLAYNITKNIPSSTAKTEKVSDKYNELTITTISGVQSSDAGFVSGICEKLIRSGYPIYILEVG